MIFAYQVTNITTASFVFHSYVNDENHFSFQRRATFSTIHSVFCWRSIVAVVKKRNVAGSRADLLFIQYVKVEFFSGTLWTRDGESY